MMICPECFRTWGDDEEECPKCGSELSGEIEEDE